MERIESGSEAMRRYIQEVVIQRTSICIDDDTRLVSSGLIDSMALVELLVKLEELTNLRIPAGKVSPRDMDSVRLMFATAARVGRPRR